MITEPVESLFYFRDYLFRFLRPGVVGSDDRPVGQPGGHLAHPRAFQSVAVAAAAKDQDDLPGVKAANGCSRFSRATSVWA